MKLLDIFTQMIYFVFLLHSFPELLVLVLCDHEILVSFRLLVVASHYVNAQTTKGYKIYQEQKYVG